MRLLLDISENRMHALPPYARPFLAGQLLTPLTGYRRWSDTFAIDNGAYSKTCMFKIERFQAIIERESEHKTLCSWVAVPDCVGSARRTREVWKYRFDMVPAGWPLAYVCQDGSEDIGIPWDDCAAVFIGGHDQWKDGRHAADIVKTAKMLGKLVHVGRVNGRSRFKHFEKLGADTCDGSSIAQRDCKLKLICVPKKQRAMMFADLDPSDTPLGDSGGEDGDGT